MDAIPAVWHTSRRARCRSQPWTGACPVGFAGRDRACVRYDTVDGSASGCADDTRSAGSPRMLRALRGPSAGKIDLWATWRQFYGRVVMDLDRDRRMPTASTFANSCNIMPTRGDNTVMEIASEDTHRLLFYVGAVTRRGYQLSVPEFEAYAKGPFRKTKIIEGGISAFRDIQNMFSPRRVPAETWLEYLKRLRWVSADEDKVKLTRLGKAILDELSSPVIDSESESATEVLLDPADPHAYVKVIGVLAELGEGLLVDPYFRYDQLETIVEDTQIRRILTSKKTGNTALSQLQFALAVIDEDQRPLIKVADSLHDRFAIGDSGHVVAIGTSLNSVGKNHSMVVPLSETAGSAIASVYGDLWDSANTLEPRSQNNAS